MGDYSRDEWIERKRKRETEIYNLKKEIYELEKQEQNNAELNSLYKTIIESIIWLREGEDINIKINFL